jgi:5-methylcytosine-specific restriction endonuclease McrA
MDASTRNLVRARAGHRCEYCLLPETAIPAAALHIDHIRGRQHKGSEDPSNLALACQHCNLHKGPNLSGIDPDTDQIVPLFNPRKDVHSEHFALRGSVIFGLTPTGRATVAVLDMNSADRIETRSDLE